MPTLICDSLFDFDLQPYLKHVLMGSLGLESRTMKAQGAVCVGEIIFKKIQNDAVHQVRGEKQVTSTGTLDPLLHPSHQPLNLSLITRLPPLSLLPHLLSSTLLSGHETHTQKENRTGDGGEKTRGVFKYFMLVSSIRPRRAL